jgi:hypothetical protein
VNGKMEKCMPSRLLRCALMYGATTNRKEGGDDKRQQAESSSKVMRVVRGSALTTICVGLLGSLAVDMLSTVPLPIALAHHRVSSADIGLSCEHTRDGRHIS